MACGHQVQRQWMFNVSTWSRLEAFERTACCRIDPWYLFRWDGSGDRCHTWRRISTDWGRGSARREGQWPGEGKSGAAGNGWNPWKSGNHLGNLGSPNVSQSGSSAPGEVALATFDQSHAHLPQVLRYFQHLSAVVGCVMLKYVEIMWNRKRNHYSIIQYLCLYGQNQRRLIVSNCEGGEQQVTEHT